MASKIFKIKEDDTRPSLRVTLLDKDKKAVDLDGVTGVNCVLRPKGVADAETFNKAAVVIQTGSGSTAVDKGVVEYQWVAADTAAAGEFEAEFKVDLNGVDTQTYPTVGFIAVRIGEDAAT
jgi:hypothetical protein